MAELQKRNLHVKEPWYNCCLDTMAGPKTLLFSSASVVAAEPYHADHDVTGSPIKVGAMVTIAVRDEASEHTTVTGEVVVVAVA